MHAMENKQTKNTSNKMRMFISLISFISSKLYAGFVEPHCTPQRWTMITHKPEMTIGKGKTETTMLEYQNILHQN